MLKGVLFDWDGTLCDTLPVCIRAFREAMTPFMGRVMSDAEITEHFGVNELGIIMIKMPGREAEWPLALASYNEHYRRYHHLAPRPYEGIPELLDSLRQRGVKVGLVTGKASGSCAISLEYTGLRDKFDFVRSGSEKGVNKAESTAAFLREFGLRKEDVYYVGDAASDMSEARKAGVHGLAVFWSSVIFNRQAVLNEKPERSFETVTELAQYLAELP